ncbi:MAG: RluA family pseudouridine synthase [Planctomycetaceae bacterium]|nr:RluA family pseudouridine synthase [Planctomycetaceae bacterium]
MAGPQKLTVSREDRLMVYLSSVLEQNRTSIKKLLKFGAVAVNGRTVRQFDHPLRPGDIVAISTLHAAAASERLEAMGIQLLYEDDDLIVVDKPSGLLTVPSLTNKTDTLIRHLNDFLQQRDRRRAVLAQVVHRIDQETSGLVLFARSLKTNAQLQDNWPSVEKTYWAIVEGQPPQEQGTITSHLVEDDSYQVYSYDEPTPNTRHATTHYRVLQTRDGLSLLEIRLETGRKHQIRVQMATHLGCPVAGDRRYGAKSDPCGRLALHAGRLTLAHPTTGERLTWESPLPRPIARFFPGSRASTQP